jgi:hypothetical protein
MKTMREKEREIYFKFKEVTKSWFHYSIDGFGTIKLDGTFCSDELKEIARVLDEVNHETPEEKEIKRIRNINIDGLTYKDIKVIYYLIHKNSETFSYSFFITKDGKDYDFYRGRLYLESHDWWPDSDQELNFIPKGFFERCENCYGYNGTDAEAIELLKKCGFTVEPEKTT